MYQDMATEMNVEVNIVNLPSREGTTVFLRARTKPRGEPNRKKSDTSKSNLPRAPPPSSIVLLLDRREPGSFLKTLACKLHTHTTKKKHQKIIFHIMFLSSFITELLCCVQFSNMMFVLRTRVHQGPSNRAILRI